MRYFSTEERCLQYIELLKWGEKGWKCFRCGKTEYYRIYERHLNRCKNCHYDESYTANTVMRNTRRPLTDWFYAIYAVSTNKTGMSAMELYRQTGAGSYSTCWLILHKIRLAMTEPWKEKLDFDVEADETYIFTRGKKGGRKVGGKKALIVGAVEVGGFGKKIKSGRGRLRAIGSASSKNLNSFIRDHVEQGSIVRTDGWKGYSGLKELGYEHRPTILKRPEDASRKLPRIHRLFSNLKTWIKGTHRYVSRKHLQNYLNEHLIRFNNRNRPIEVFNDILRLMVRAEPRTYREFVKPRRPAYPNPLDTATKKVIK